jgi:uncharacterized protein YqeY
LSAIDNAEAVDAPALRGPTLGVGAGDVPRRTLAPHEVIDIIRAEVDERLSAAAGYERSGRAEHAARLRAEADALGPYSD